jgi:hypothetical protein
MAREWFRIVREWSRKSSGDSRKLREAPDDPGTIPEATRSSRLVRERSRTIWEAPGRSGNDPGSYGKLRPVRERSRIIQERSRTRWEDSGRSGKVPGWSGKVPGGSAGETEIQFLIQPRAINPLNLPVTFFVTITA